MVAFQDLLFSRTGRLALYFQRYFDQIVGRSTYLAAALTALAESPRRPGELAKAIKAGTADTSRYVERLGDAVRRTDGVLSVDDPLFAMWLRWRGPAGAVVPMSVLGDAAERRAAEHLAALGFDLVYQSRASRGAFDLLAIRGGGQLGVQVKRTARLPLRFSPAAWARMEADAERFGWGWAVVHVDPDDAVRVLDPARARRGREIRLGAEATIENVLLWCAARR